MTGKLKRLILFLGCDLACHIFGGFCARHTWGLSSESQRAQLALAWPVQEALDLEEGQEEAWVIRSIGRKLLEARIDQMRRVVIVSKLAHRAFTHAQWAELRTQLAAWKVGRLADCGCSRAKRCAESGLWCQHCAAMRRCKRMLMAKNGSLLMHDLRCAGERVEREGPGGVAEGRRAQQRRAHGASGPACLSLASHRLRILELLLLCTSTASSCKKERNVASRCKPPW